MYLLNKGVLKSFLSILLVVSCLLGKAQTFPDPLNSNSGTVPFNNFNYLTNGIAVPNLGVLDGISLGVTSITLNITGQGTIDLYLVAPDGHAVFIMSNSFNVTNKSFTFSTDPNAPRFNYLSFQNTDIISPQYHPYGNLNSFNVNQFSSEGTWRLYAKTGNLFSPPKINSWSITFGSTNLMPGSKNQNCANAFDLKITAPPSNDFVTGSSQYNGIVVSDSKGSEVGNSGLTETSVWYKFIPKCRDDKIEIKPTNSNYIQSGVLTGTCSSRGFPSGQAANASHDIIGAPYTYSLNYTPGNTYFLVMDGSEAETFTYEVRWYEGTIGCTQSNSVTTRKPSKTSYCVNDTIHIKYSTQGTFGTNNRFTAQLSDANGSFASPQDLNSILATTGGTIVVTLPSTLPSGSGYKVRVMSNDPVATTVTESGTFQIASVPSAPATQPNGHFSVCAGQTNVNYATSAPPSGVHYRWKFPTGTQVFTSTSDSSSISVNFGNTGGNISLQAVNLCGASAALTNHVIVNALVKPEVTIVGDTALCSGSPATFTATTKNKGAIPIFTWSVNEVQQGSAGQDSTLKLSSFQDYDTVKVLLSSSAPCASPSLITARPRIIRLTTTLVPSVSIVGDTQVCDGDSPDFQAKATNEGSGASYVWKINGDAASAQGPLFSSNNLANYDTLTVELTSKSACASPKFVLSDPVVITVNERLKPTISLSTLKQGTCQGDTFLFQASPFMGGTHPQFKWAINGIATGDTTPEFQSTNLKTNDTIRVLMTSNAYCVSDSIVGDSLNVSITDTVHVGVSIGGDPLVCPVLISEFQAKLTSSLPNALFDWFVNDTLQSFHGSAFSSFFKDKDTIKVILANASTCMRPYKPRSSPLVLSAKTPVAPVTPIYGPVQACSGDTLSFSAQVSQGGTNPIFQWYINEMAQLNDTLPSFTTDKLRNGDSIYVQVKGNEDCAVPNWTKSTVYTMSIQESTFPSVSIQHDSIYCVGQDIFLAALPENQGSYESYAWEIDGIPYPSDSSIIQVNKGLSAGSHEIFLTMSNLGDCARPGSVKATNTFILKDSVKINVGIIGDTVLCVGSATTFSLSNQLNASNIVYNWQLNGATTGTNQPFYDYLYAQNKDSISLLVTTDELCTSSNQLMSNTLSIHAVESIVPKITVSASQSEVCVNKEVTLLASVENPGANEQFQWFAAGELIQGADSRDLVYLVQTPIQITLKYKTDLTCGTVLIPVNAPPLQVKSTPTLTTLLGPNDFCRQDKDVLFSTDIIDNVKYVWSIPNGASIKGDGDKILLSLSENSGLDTLKVKAQNDCGDGNELYLALSPKNCSKLFIPNAIASNDGNGNNVWQIKGLENYPNAQIQVFNRWGEKVFQSQGYTVPWDGSIKDKPLPAGTYYYVIQGTGEKTLSGDLTIIH